MKQADLCRPFMSLSDPSPPSPVDEPVTGPPEALPRISLAGWRRMRLAVYLAFAVIVGNAALQAWQTQRMAQSRLLGHELVGSAAMQNATAQRMGRLAAVIALRPDLASRPVVDLGAELSRSRALALHSQQQQSVVRPDAAIAALLDRWQDARERLWYRADSLLAHIEAGRHDALPEASAAVQGEADRAAAAAQALVDGLQARLGAEQDFGLQVSRVGMGLTAALLLLVAMCVVAPALRALQA